MTPDKIKQFWLTLATFKMSNKKDHEFFAQLVVDSFNRMDGEVTYRLALIMIKGMLQKASSASLDEFLCVAMSKVAEKDQMRFINQVTVATQLVLVIEKCDGLYNDLVASQAKNSHQTRRNGTNGFSAMAH